MAERVVPMQVAGVELLVQTVTVPGLEHTSGRMARAGDRAVEGFDRAQAAIEAIAAKTADTLRGLGKQALRPDRLAVEFGLCFTAEGGVLVAGSSVQASLKVTITYDRPLAAAAVTTDGTG
jgi:hypothetical protein